MTRDPRQIVGFDIAHDKDESRIQKIADKAPKAKFYFSDANPSYRNVSYFGLHSYFYDKSQTFTVEGVNSDLRHYIPALRRRSKCFFRSLETMLSVFKIFVFAFNKFALAKFNFPSIKSSLSLSSFI